MKHVFILSAALLSRGRGARSDADYELCRNFSPKDAREVLQIAKDIREAVAEFAAL